MGSGTPPRVFISYSHDSDEHQREVLELAQKLREDGIDAWLDVFDPAPPQGWPRWLTEQVQRADFVVLVCTEDYRRRFEGRAEPGRELGATFEALLANQLLYEKRLDYERLVPVIFDGSGDELIPLAVRAAASHVIPGQYEQLRLRLTGQLAITPVPVGVATEASKGLPDELRLTDELSLYHDELERLTLAGKDTSEVHGEIRRVRRQIRDGPSLEIGEILAGRCRLVEEAGKGGFATVWRAYDPKTATIVAVKVLHGQWAGDRSRIERFKSGARRMGSLRHEAVVPMLVDATQDEHHHFYVMQWLEGGSLHRALTRGTLDRRTALEAVARVARGLAYAHERGVVHRDVKPANILLDERGRGFISDFDLARAKDSTHGTRTGGLGTFVYAAPEQHQNASTADARADVYGLGMSVLFVLLGNDPPAFVSRIHPELFEELECGAGLRETVRVAVAYDAEDRTVSCEELAAAAATIRARGSGISTTRSRLARSSRCPATAGRSPRLRSPPTRSWRSPLQPTTPSRSGRSAPRIPRRPA